MEKDGRHNGIDILKIIATIFVVVLHVNGFLSDTIPLAQFSLSTNVLYHISQAVAYPAIHLFVMVTAYFTIEKGTNKKTIITIWSQTFIICIIGLVLAVILKVPFGIKELIRSLVPFSGRAYWYVSDYIVLMLIAPILDKVIMNISTKELRYLILVMFGIVSFGPAFLSFFDWNQNYSNIGLFIFLYFVVAGMKKDTNIFSRAKGGILWIISVVCLAGTWIVLYILGNIGISGCVGREMFFYQYWSPFVIIEAIGLFKIYSEKKIIIINKVIKKLLFTVANASLIVYLVHMHPIFKLNYVKWGSLSVIDVNNLLVFMFELLLIIIIIFISGIICSIPVVKLAGIMSKKIMAVINKKRN